MITKDRLEELDPLPGPAITLQKLLLRFPTIPWREPLPVRWSSEARPRLLFPTPGKAGDPQTFACRICTARLGLKRTSSHQWPTIEEARDHIACHTP